MIHGDLPPDPENMNGKRAQWAEAAIRQFQIVTGTEWDNCVEDLLCDLMHFCDRHTFENGETSFDFEAALATARMHYEAETAPDTTYGDDLVFAPCVADLRPLATKRK